MEEEGQEERLLSDEIDLDFHLAKDHNVNLQLPTRPTNIRLILYIELIHIILLLLAISLWYFINNPNPSSQLTSITSYTRISRQRSTITFPEDDASFLNTTLPTPDADSLWFNLTVGNNNGFVSLPSSFITYYNLPVTYLPTNPGENVYQLNVFHQLHCLRNIRSYIVMPLRNKTSSNYTFDDTNLSSDLQFQHTLHCVDFLRRVLMCNADLTLMDTNIDPGFKGYGPRQCVDWEAVREWLGKNAWDRQRFHTDHGHDDSNTNMSFFG
jgi:hypothetical protein